MVEKFPVVNTFSITQSFCSGNALSWSKDNKMTLATQEALYILDMKCQTKISKQSLYLSKLLIPADSSCLNFNLDTCRDFLHNHLERGKLFHLFLNRTLSPFNAGSQSFKGFSQAKWSPFAIDKSNRYFLVTLTMNFQVMIHKVVGKTTVIVKDITSRLFDYLKEKLEIVIGDDCPEATDNKTKAEYLLNRLQDQVYKVATVDVVWSNLFSCDKSNSKFILLFTIQKSGHVAVWKITVPYENDDDCLICFYCASSVKNPTTISWYQKDKKSGILAIGSFDGEVKLLQFFLNEEDILTAGSEHTAWEDQDSLAVTHILFLSGTNKINTKTETAKKLAILISKETILITCYLNIDTYNSSCYTSLRTSCNLPFSGFTMVQNCLLATSFDGSVLQINYQFEKQGLILTTENLSFELMRQHVTTHGIASSPNGALIAFTECFIKGLYDQHVCKEPLKVHWLIAKDANQILMDLLSHTGLIRDRFDDLECLRLLLVSENVVPPKLMEICQLVETHLTDQSTQRLKLIRMLLLMLWSEYQQVETFKNRLVLVENLIMERHIITFLVKFKNVPIEGANVTSINRMCKWLEKYSSSVSIQEMTSSIQNKLKLLELPVESCIICQELEICDSYQRVTCKNEHTFPLCCHSLLTCNTTSNRECNLCQTLAVPSSDGSCVECTFCDGVME